MRRPIRVAASVMVVSLAPVFGRQTRVGRRLEERRVSR